MKKKLLSLALVLALTLTLMLPTFAATAQPADPHAECVHSWVDIAPNPHIGGYVSVNAYTHLKQYYMRTMCQKCCVYSQRYLYSVEDYHSFSNDRCTLCGYVIP